MVKTKSDGNRFTSEPRQNYRNFKRDISRLDGVPISDIDKDLIMAATVLKNEGYLSLKIINGKISYCKTRKADQTLEAMI